MTTPVMQRAASLLGMNETDQRAAIQEYLANGGVNLDPAVTAWCAAFVNATLAQGGLEGTGSNMARSFLDWGEAVDTPQIGDIVVFSRGDPNGPFGHVGFFQGYDDQGNIRVLGGNQGGAQMGGGGVTESVYGADRLLGFRRASGQGGGGQTAPQPGERPMGAAGFGGMTQDQMSLMREQNQLQRMALAREQFGGEQRNMLDPAAFMRPVQPMQAVPLTGMVR